MKVKEVHIQSGIAEQGPPLEVRLNGGTILEMSFKEAATSNYTIGEILELLQEAGLDAHYILFPIPTNTPLNSRITLLPGTHQVIHRRGWIDFPESAFQYSQAK